MKDLISFCCSLVFVTASIILCVEFKIEWSKAALAVGWFAHFIHMSVFKYLTKDKNEKSNN